MFKVNAKKFFFVEYLILKNLFKILIECKLTILSKIRFWWVKIPTLSNINKTESAIYTLVYLEFFFKLFYALQYKQK